MNEQLKENKVDVPAASSYWAGQHMYDKRLVTLMSKDAGIKVTARKTVRIRKERNGGNGSEGEDAQEQIDGSQLPGRGRPKGKAVANGDSQSHLGRAKAAPKKVVSKPQTLPTRRSNRSTVQQGTSNYIEGGSDESEEEEEQVTLLSVRSAPSQRKQRAPTPSDDESDAARDQVTTRETGAVLPGRRRGPKAAGSKKRPRQESDDDDALPSHLHHATAAAPSVSLPDGDLSATPASSRRGVSPDPVMDLSTQELAETESQMPDVPDTPPGLDSQSNAGTGLPRRKRSRF